MNAVAQIPFESIDPLASEALTSREWATLLGVTPRAVQMEKLPCESKIVRGGIAKVIAYEHLPERWKELLSAKRERHAASTYGSLLEMRSVETRWVPQREWMSYPEATRERAMKKQAVAKVYFAALDADKTKGEANIIAQAEWIKQFGEPCNEKSIRRLEELVESRGGIDFAPLEAYCDGKSCPHTAARREVKLGISPALIAEFADRCTKVEHISAAFRSLEIDWLMGRAVPGLGVREGNAPFPFKLPQLRDYAPSTPARRLHSHGKARARREALPAMRTSTALLRRAELYMLDDTRIDIIATRDSDGKPVELKSYWLIDVGSRRIEGFVIREAGNIRANDVDCLLARVLRSSGLAKAGAGYKTLIKFERGTVACSPARKSFLLGSFPGRLEIDSTAIDGGKNNSADFAQSRSGHWMGKAHIESFMRTVAFFLEHVPGQRGGVYRRQPAQLGLVGKDRETGLLNYDAGSRMHEAALLEYGNRALEWIETGELSGDVNLRRLKVSALWPVSWVTQALQEFVAYYNQRTDHRMEGFARIEYLDENGAKKWRMESPNERATVLDRLCPTERISASDAAFMLSHKVATKTVKAATASAGITMDVDPWKDLRFWKPDSIACHEAAQLTTLEKKYVAVYDEEAIKLWQPGQPVPEIHLLTGTPGEAGARYLETLPLAAYGDRTDPDSLAREAAKSKEIERRALREVLRTTAPTMVQRIAEAKENANVLRGVVTTLDTIRDTSAPSSLITDIRTGAPIPAEPPTQSRLAERQAAQAGAETDAKQLTEALYDER